MTSANAKNFKVDGKFFPVNEELARNWYAKKYLPTTAYILVIRSILKKPNEPLTISNVKEFCSFWGITTSSFYRAITTLAHNGDITWEATGSVIIKTTEKVVPFVGLVSHERDTDSHERDTDSHERDTDSHERDTCINNDRARSDHSNIQIKTDLFKCDPIEREEAIAPNSQLPLPGQASPNLGQQQDQKNVPLPAATQSGDDFDLQSQFWRIQDAPWKLDYRTYDQDMVQAFFELHPTWGICKLMNGKRNDRAIAEHLKKQEGVAINYFGFETEKARMVLLNCWDRAQEIKAKKQGFPLSAPTNWDTDPRKDAWLAEYKRTNKMTFLLNGHSSHIDDERYEFWQHALERGWLG